jgi:class 3 adenylate cyclase
MRCSNCETENTAGSRFCNQCGTPLGKTCTKCGAENADNAKFCSQCGSSLERVQEDGGESQPAARGQAGERRHLTVLFCDLVGSSEIAAQLDPEEWREVIAEYHRAAAEAITRFGGHVAKYLGDGVMAYFGWPEAHDNDGERAARAGLAIVEALSKLDSNLRLRCAPRRLVSLLQAQGVGSPAPLALRLVCGQNWRRGSALIQVR